MDRGGEGGEGRHRRAGHGVLSGSQNERCAGKASGTVAWQILRFRAAARRNFSCSVLCA
ncbi:protein of unknown function [Burkholderia multivorans]